MCCKYLSVKFSVENGQLYHQETINPIVQKPVKMEKCCFLPAGMMTGLVGRNSKSRRGSCNCRELNVCAREIRSCGEGEFATCSSFIVPLHSLRILLGTLVHIFIHYIISQFCSSNAIHKGMQTQASSFR